MTNARVFAQHLYSQNIHDGFARLALANFFHNYLDPEAELSANMFNEFYFRSLEFSYWRKNCDELTCEVQNQIESFLRHRKAELDIEKILRPNELQFIDIENDSDFSKIVERHFRNISQPGEELKLIRSEEMQLLIHILPEDGIRVQQLSQLAYIYNGEIIPVPGPKLSYSQNLELKPDITQRIRIDRYNTVSFRNRPPNTRAIFVKGYTFRQDDRVESTHLYKVPKLFYALKSLEKNFIDIESDPFYQSMNQRLEKAIQLLKKDSQTHLELGLNCYEQGRLVIENVFSNDKTLKMLVKELGQHLVVAWQEKKQLSQENSWQNPNLEILSKHQHLHD